MIYEIYFKKVDYQLTDAYLCKGTLLNYYPKAEVVVQKLQCNEHQISFESCGSLSIFHAMDAPKGDPWFLTPDEVCEFYNSKLLSIRIRHATLLTDQVKPIEFPILRNLVKGKKGYQCRIIPHPEQDGTRGDGKFFFPDRTFKDACEGPAVITGITKEFDRYGFISGQMINFEEESASRTEFLRFLFESSKARYPEYLNSARIAEISHPVRGNYIAIGKLRYGTMDRNDPNSYYWDRLARQDDGNVTFWYEPIICTDIHDGFMTDWNTVQDFLLKEKFGLTTDD